MPLINELNLTLSRLLREAGTW